MAAWMIDEFGSKELREKFIPELASMEVITVTKGDILFRVIFVVT